MSSIPLLAVEIVTKQYGSLAAVKGVSFDVFPGEVFGFLGPNGAGKTTTLRMIMDITRPDAGVVRFEGRPALDRTRVGYLPEERGLYDDASLLDILVYLGTLRGMKRSDARAAAMRWLEKLELADRAKDKVNTLSKGNQQKVQFVGAVLHRPVLAVLDEPFSGLDPLNQELFIDIIGDLRRQGAAVLLSSHQLDLVERLCDRFFLIARGQRVLSGTLNAMREEVAGGAHDVLTLSLRGRAGEEEAIEAVLDRVGQGLEREVRREAGGGLHVELTLRPEVDLNAILAEIGRRYIIGRVHMRPLPLHEIYLRAVRGDRVVSAEEAREMARV
jgi:ABC-2 type transport system ATP-binding protein